ncbi:MAG: hypothetical protein JSR17_01710 [Proteobacteria bacterium]|nr:hypothetical protein [Pseudomonadota bacterium]
MKTGAKKTTNKGGQAPQSRMGHLEVADITQYLDNPEMRASLPVHVVEAFQQVRALGDLFILESGSNLSASTLRNLSIQTFIDLHKKTITAYFDIFATYIFNKLFTDLEKLIKEKSEDNLLKCYANLTTVEAFIQHVLPLVENDNYKNTRDAFIGILLKYMSVCNSAIISLLDAKRLKPNSYYFWYHAIIEKIDWLILYGREYQTKLIRLFDTKKEDDNNNWINVKHFLELYKTSFNFCTALKLDSRCEALTRDIDAFCGQLRVVCNSNKDHPKAQETSERIASVKEGMLKRNDDDLLTFFREMDDYIQNQDLNAPKVALENLKIFEDDCKATELALKELTHQSKPSEAIRLFNKVLQHIKQCQVLPHEQCQEETIKSILRALFHVKMILNIPQLINDTFLRCILEDMFTYFIKKLTEDLKNNTAAAKREAQLKELEAQFKALQLEEKPAETLKEEDKRHQEELKRMRNEHAQAVAAHRQVVAQESEKRRKEKAQLHAQEIERLKKELEGKYLQEVAESNSRNAERSLKSEQQRERQIRDLEQSHADKIAALKREEQDKKDELEMQNAAVLQELQKKREADLKAVKAKHSKNMTQTQARLEKQLETQKRELEEESEADLKAAQLEHEQALSKLQEDFQKQGQALVEQSDKEYADQLKALEAEYQRAKARHAETLNLQRTTLAEQVAVQIESARRAYQQRQEQESAKQKRLPLKDPLMQVNISPEQKFILACLGDRECYITGPWLRNVVLRRPVYNEAIEVLVKGIPSVLGPITQGCIKHPEFPNVIRLGSIVFNCIGEANFTDVLRQRLLVVDGLLCEPQTGNVYNVLGTNENLVLNPLKVHGNTQKRFKENPGLIFQLFRTHYELQLPFAQDDLEAIKCHAGQLIRFPIASYQEMLQYFFLSNHGSSNYCYAFQNNMLHQFFPFLPQNYAQTLTIQFPQLGQFWFEKLSLFLAQPQQYNANHLLALFFMYKILQRTDQHEKIEVYLSRCMNTFFMAYTGIVTESEKETIRRSIESILLEPVSSANPLGGLYVQYLQFEQAAPQPAPVLPAYAMHVQGRAGDADNRVEKPTKFDTKNVLK